MLLDFLTLCTIPLAVVTLALLPWSDAKIEETDREARTLVAYVRSRIFG